MNRRGRHARWPLLIGLLLLLALIPFAFLRSSQVPEAEAAWWNESWRYRQSIAVTNNTTQQTNVYISVSLDTSNTSKFQADCGDLRFTKQNGQLLPYYIVSGCGTASTSVHIQLDTFPAGVQTLYAYYGNPSADNGFSSNDFLTQATNYTMGGIGSEETGSGPVAYWKFDEGSGSTANDSAGSNSGTITGATWASENQCVSGKCLSFDGSGDYVNHGNASALDFDHAQSFTVSAWVRYSTQTAGNNYPGIVTKIQPVAIYRGYGLAINTGAGENNNKVYFALGDGTNTRPLYSTTRYDDNSWHHVVGLVNRATQQSSIYIDGKNQNSQDISMIGSPSNAINFYIGNRGGSNYLNGQIDDVRIFPYALTEDQIKTEYNLGAAAVMGTGPTIAPPVGGTLSDSLVAHWAFDEQYGQTAHDKVGNNHGTFGASTSPGSDDPTWTAAGECKVNGCLGFDGADYANVGDLSSLDFSDSNSKFTVTAWLKPTTIDSTQKIVVGKYNPTGNMRSWAMGVEANNKMTVWLSEDGTYSSSTTVRYQSASTVVANELHHWAFVINIEADTFTIYRDGVLESGTHLNSKTTVTDIHNGTAPVMMGALSSLASYFTGNIDELKIYNTALTADQVKQDMNAGASVAYSVGSEEADELADGAGAPPIAEWKFDEKQGTVAYDSSGHANDGTVNGATWKSGCKQGACLVFDGSGTHVDAGASSLLKPSSFTISSWVYYDSSLQTDSYGAIFANVSSNKGYELLIQRSDRQVWWAISQKWAVNLTGYSIPEKTWTYLTMIYDIGSGTKIYANGVKVASDPTAGDIVYNLSSNFHIGNRPDINSTDFGGQIDHVRIYDYARTPAQIAYDYNRGAPVAHWKFDECEGTVAHDASGNENHGTINIGATGTQTTAGTCSTSGAWANGASGKFEGSLNFDGTDDYVESNATLSTIPFTLSAWVKYTGSLTTPGLVSFTDANGRRRDVYIYNNNMLRIFTYDGTNARYYVSPSIKSFNDGQWHHIVGTFDGTTPYVYADGVRYSVSTPVNAGVYPAGIIRIGAQNISPMVPAYYFPGQIDDVRIYNYALSPAQLVKVYNQGFGVRYGPEAGNQ